MGNFNTLDEEDDISDDVLLASFINKRDGVFKWLRQTDFGDVKESLFPQQDTSKYRNLTPVEVFGLFLNNESMDFLVEESEKYATFNNHSNPNITRDEMRCFFGILIVSGYDKKPSKKSY